MSFTNEIKKELTQTEYSTIQQVSSFSALLRSSSELVIKNRTLNFELSTLSELIAKYIVLVAKKEFSLNGELITIDNGNLKRKMYRVSLQLNHDVLAKLDFLEGISFKGTISKKLVENEEGLKGYLRGVFILTGNVSDPSTSKYHLDMKLDDYDYAKSVQSLINSFGLNAKISQTKNSYLVYLKKAENISDFLKIIGVTKAVLYYEDVRISRDMYNNTNRLVNCDVANTKKTFESAQKQLDNIKYLKKHVNDDAIPDSIKDIIKLRLKYKEASLNELIGYSESILGYSLTKSGLNHRFRKLNEYTKKIKELNND